MNIEYIVKYGTIRVSAPKKDKNQGNVGLVKFLESDDGSVILFQNKPNPFPYLKDKVHVLDSVIHQVYLLKN